VAQALAERYAAWLPPTLDELHTRQIAWARAQARSLTEYFVSIGRIDPDDTLDGSWPIR
jgi:DNA polymerase-3 subunit epsilon